jgi:peptide/nickel transport system permease protein
MLAFVGRRLALGMLTLVGASILVFALTNLIPGDIVRNVVMAGDSAEYVDEETIQLIREKLGLNRPQWVQYFDWMRRVFTGEMGFSYKEKVSVGSMVRDRIMPTMHVAFQAVLLAWIFGLPLGIISAIRRNSAIDFISRIISVLGLAIPFFWIGILIVWISAVHFSYFPPLIYEPPWINPWISFQKTIGASVVLALLLMAYIARMSRGALLEVLQEDYVRTARAKGLREHVVIIRHALKIALLPVLTLSAVQLGKLLGGTVVVEQIFNIHGLGSMTIDAVINKDVSVVQNAVLLLSFVFVIVNLLNDLLLGWLDPRIRRT